MFRCFVSLSVTLLFVTASVAAAARPMAVSVFEARAYAEPRDDAEVVEVFVEGTELSAAEEATDGWLRVRLASGAVGWMHEGDLKPNREPATILRRPEPAPAPPPRVQVYVKDLDHLAELVREDEVVYPMAEALVSDETTATVVAWSGIVVGGLLIVGSVLALDRVDRVDSNNRGSYTLGSPDYPTYNSYSYESPDYTTSYALLGAGTAVCLVGWLVREAVTPGKDDLLDVLNAWNGRHPNEPFTLDR